MSAAELSTLIVTNYSRRDIPPEALREIHEDNLRAIREATQ